MSFEQRQRDTSRWRSYSPSATKYVWHSREKRHLRPIKSMNHISIASSRKSIQLITFTDTDFVGVNPKQDDPMVITVGIANWDIREVLIDRGSLTNIRFWSTFQRLEGRK